MNWTRGIALMGLIVLFSLGTTTPAFAQTTYEVTIQNLTQNQVITPPVVVSHSGAMSLFTVGQPVIPELATLAEEGDPGDLLALLPTLPAVFDFAAGPGPHTPCRIHDATSDEQSWIQAYFGRGNAGQHQRCFLRY